MKRSATIIIVMVIFLILVGTSMILRNNTPDEIIMDGNNGEMINGKNEQIVGTRKTLFWKTEIVDSNGDPGSHNSIDVDSNNNPHIAYQEFGEKVLKYAYINGDKWEIQTVDSSDEYGEWRGYYPNMVINSKDRPRIGYRIHEYKRFSSSSIRYAKLDDNQWKITAVNTGSSPSMVLDTNDTPHFSYWTPNSENLEYFGPHGDWPGGYTVLAGTSSSYNSIAIDSNNYPHIIYSTSNDILIYTYFNGTKWNFWTIGNGTPGDIVVDSNNIPHIFYLNDGIKYAFLDGAQWQIENVDDGASYQGMGNFQIALDSNNKPHIVYLNDGLKYARYDGGQWEIEIIDSSTSIHRSPSICLDSNNIPHISSHDNENNYLLYSTMTDDFDNDGVKNEFDVFPYDPLEHTDTDGDGVGDNKDDFPNDPLEHTDTDVDGVGDNTDNFPSDPFETKDTDNDGIGDNADKFPNDSAASKDSDGDKYPDEWNVGKSEKDSTTNLKIDQYPNDPGKWKKEDENNNIIWIGTVALIILGVILWVVFSRSKRK